MTLYIRMFKTAAAVFCYLVYLCIMYILYLKPLPPHMYVCTYILYLCVIEKRPTYTHVCTYLPKVYLLRQV